MLWAMAGRRQSHGCNHASVSYSAQLLFVILSFLGGGGVMGKHDVSMTHCRVRSSRPVCDQSTVQMH